MIEAGVPCVPEPGGRQKDETLIAEVKKSAFLMVKAVAGGGGRGMRLVEAPEDCRGHYNCALGSKMPFGSGELILKRRL